MVAVASAQPPNTGASRRGHVDPSQATVGVLYAPTMGSFQLTRSVTVVTVVAALGFGCSSSSVNEGSGGTPGTGATSGAGGASGGGGGGGSGGGSGTCMQKTAQECVSCCRSSDPDGYLEFVKTLKNFVCSNTTCTKPCDKMCTEGDTTPLCAECIIAPPLASSVLVEVKNNCAQYQDPKCVAWAACAEACMK